MSDTQAWSLLVGFFMTMIISLLKQAGLPKLMNSLIAITSCVIAGLVTAAATGQFHGTTAVAAIAIVFASAQGLYQTFWNIPALSEGEAKLSAATSIVKTTKPTNLTRQSSEAIADSWARLVESAKTVVDWDTHVKDVEKKLEHVRSELKDASE
jgi:hypothetical protein